MPAGAAMCRPAGAPTPLIVGSLVAWPVLHSMRRFAIVDPESGVFPLSSQKLERRSLMRSNRVLAVLAAGLVMSTASAVLAEVSLNRANLKHTHSFVQRSKTLTGVCHGRKFCQKRFVIYLYFKAVAQNIPVMVLVVVKVSPK